MDPSLYSALLTAIAAIFVAAFLLTTWRIISGPNSLDRLVGLDGLVAIVQCALGVYICWTMDTTVAAAMLVIALLGFIATLAVTRFRKRDA